MKWPWKKVKKNEEHTKELSDVADRLGVIVDQYEDVADRFDDQIAVLRRNGE